MSHTIIEAEIIHEPIGYSQYSAVNSFASAITETNKAITAMGILALFICFIPVVGFVYALTLFVVMAFQKIPPILPIIALAISGVTTMLFFVFVWIMQLIF